MPDNRTRREKLEAMANQTASPNEAEIARRLLAEMGVPETRQRAERAADEFLSRMTFEYDAAGTTVHYDGPRGPGVIGAMLRAAVARQRAREASLLDD